MKKLLLVLLICSFQGLAFTVAADQGPQPRDRFPWSWGSECPFPWDAVTGVYKVKSISGNKVMDGSILKLKPTRVKHLQGPVLTVSQYTGEGELYRAGLGAAVTESRIITAYTRRKGEDTVSAKMYIRAYLADSAYRRNQRARNCASGPMVLTATFCTLKGQHCLKTQNYILQKVR